MPITQTSEPREIHLWCIFTREVSTDSRPRRYHRLDDWDQRRELHFYFAHDRYRYVMTRASVRGTESPHHAGAPLEAFTLVSTRRGRPGLAIGGSAAVVAVPVPVSASTGWQPRRFREYWTLQESYMRTKGGGFSIPLDNFSFHLPYSDSVPPSTRAKSNDVPDGWRFWQFSLGSKHLVAARTEPGLSEAPRLVLREVVPLAAATRMPAVRIAEMRH